MAAPLDFEEKRSVRRETMTGVQADSPAARSILNSTNCQYWEARPVRQMAKEKVRTAPERRRSLCT